MELTIEWSSESHPEVSDFKKMEPLYKVLKERWKGTEEEEEQHKQGKKDRK